jgi:hypothetical protein
MNILKIFIFLFIPVYTYAGVTSALVGGVVGYTIGSSGKQVPVDSNLQSYKNNCYLNFSNSNDYLVCINQSSKPIPRSFTTVAELRQYQSKIKIEEFNPPILLSQNFLKEYFFCEQVSPPKLVYSSWYDKDQSITANYLTLQVKTIYNLNNCGVK